MSGGKPISITQRGGGRMVRAGTLLFFAAVVVAWWLWGASPQGGGATAANGDDGRGERRSARKNDHSPAPTRSPRRLSKEDAAADRDRQRREERAGLQLQGRSFSHLMGRTEYQTEENRRVQELIKEGRFDEALAMLEASTVDKGNTERTKSLFFDWVRADPQAALAAINGMTGRGQPAVSAALGYGAGLQQLEGPEPERRLREAAALIKDPESAKIILWTACHWMSTGRISAMEVMEWWRETNAKRATGMLGLMPGNIAQSLAMACSQVDAMMRWKLTTIEERDTIIEQNLEVMRAIETMPEIRERDLDYYASCLGHVAGGSLADVKPLDAYALPVDERVQRSFFGAIGRSLGGSTWGSPPSPAEVASLLSAADRQTNGNAQALWGRYSQVWARGKPPHEALAALAAAPVAPELHERGAPQIIGVMKESGRQETIDAVNALPEGRTKEIYRQAMDKYLR